jgi:hypothetical protein
MFYNPFVKPQSAFTTEQIASIRKEAKGIFDKIMSFEEMGDQIDVVGKRGGDICHFRWYADGTMVEK